MERDVTGEVRAAGAVEDNVSRPWVALAVDEVIVWIALALEAAGPDDSAATAAAGRSRLAHQDDW